MSTTLRPSEIKDILLREIEAAERALEEERQKGNAICLEWHAALEAAEMLRRLNRTLTTKIGEVIRSGSFCTAAAANLTHALTANEN